MTTPPPRPTASGATAPPPRDGARFAGPPRTPPVRTRSRRWLIVVAIAVAALLVGLGFGFLLGRATAPAATPIATASPAPTDESSVSPSDGPTQGARPTPEPEQPDAAAEALDLLLALPASSGEAPTTYDRDLFGQRWADIDRNGCDTRNDILGRDLLDPVFKDGTRDCKVLTGRLIDPYDGRAVDFVSGEETSQLVPVDHVVALSWAWHHGAYAWSGEQRMIFANDPANLVATTMQINQEKSDYGPSEWLPPVDELQCPYIENWVSVVSAYGLGIDDADRAAARAVLKGCL